MRSLGKGRKTAMEVIVYQGPAIKERRLKELIGAEVSKCEPSVEAAVTLCRTEQELLQAVCTAVRHEATQLERHIPFRTDQGVQFLKLSQVIWLRGSDHRLTIHLTDGSELRSRTRRVSTREMVSPLQEAGRFFRVSRAIFVNVAHVTNVTADGVWMDDGECLPISRKCYCEWMSESKLSSETF